MSAQDHPPSPPVQQFGAQSVRRTLGRSTDVDACVALVGEVDQLLTQAAAQLQSTGATLACRAGCNFCCHLRVMVLPHEAIALFRHLQSRLSAPTAQRVRARILGSGVPGASTVPRRPCAFLIDGECAAYEVRPGACAAYHSLSRERCQASFEDPAVPSSTVALQALQMVAEALEEGIRGAIKAEGLSNEPVELHTAVAALLKDPALIARWRAGKPLIKAT